jgi:hypothetical protein
MDSVGRTATKSCQMVALNCGCTAELLALYASGAICPTTTAVTLYADDFAGVPDGNLPGDPPWKQYSFGNAVVGNPILEFASTATGPKCIAGSFNGFSGFLVNAHRYTMFDAGYAGFDTTQCGVFTEITFDGRTTSGGGSTVMGGLAIGVADTTSTDKILWLFGEAGGGGNVRIVTNYALGGTVLFSTAPEIVHGDICRLQLSHSGVFAWVLEAFINGVSVGSITSGSAPAILLTNAKPKSIGFWFGGTASAFMFGLHTTFMRDWKGGVA